jgi:hypothetical protein
MTEAERAEHEAFLRNQLSAFPPPPMSQQPVVAAPIYEPPPQPLTKDIHPAVTSSHRDNYEEFQDEPEISHDQGIPAVPPPTSSVENNSLSTDALPDADDFLARLEALKR